MTMNHCAVPASVAARAYGYAPTLGQLFSEFLGSDDATSKAAFPMANWQDETAYVLELDVPGVKMDDISLEVKERDLTVTAKRERAERTGGSDGRSFGQIVQRFVLPQTADTGKIEASLSHGVLTIRVAKQDEAKPRKIAIAAA